MSSKESPRVISCEKLAKTYLIYPTPAHRLWQMIWRGKRRFYTPFEALKPLSFSIEKGECVGIVGRNGSGKSTLLQLLAGTLTATSGKVEVRGKVAALLELGSGFNPDFTGRENVYLNGSILGMSTAQIETAYESIAAFAGIGEFIERPVSTYSSGMIVRLAFAVATVAQPDILIIDEALSVGDEAFQRKCFARIEQMRAEGVTVLFVSHAAQAVIQLCDRAIWLDKGVLQKDGSPKEVIDAYHKALHQSEGDNQQAAVESTTHLVPSEAMQEYPPAGGRIFNPRLMDENGEAVVNLELGKRYRFLYELQIDQSVENLCAGMLIKTRRGVEVSGAVLHLTEQGIQSLEAGQRLSVCFAFTCLLYPNSYYLNCGVTAKINGEERYLHRLVDAFELSVINPAKRNRHGVSPQGLVDMEYVGDVSLG